MKFCIALSYSPPEQYVPLAQAADAHGWDAIACSDHVVNPEVITTQYPYRADGARRWKPFTPWSDPWVVIGAMAAVTERLRFFTNVYVAPMRSPFQIAKTVGTAAALSDNRVALGIGIGWMEEEFALLGAPFARRGARTDELLDVVRTLWGGGWVEHHGEFYDFDRLEMTPTPTERVPIYVGGLSDAALRRATRHDGWISDLQTTDELAEVCATLRRYRTDLGRADEPFAVIASSKDAVTVDDYRRLEAVGVTHLLTMPWVFYDGFTDDLDQRLAGIARFADDIIAKY